MAHLKDGARHDGGAHLDDGARPDGLRVGDTERDAVTAALHDHFAAGRLDRAELDERLEAVLAAKTFGDLRALVRDLPAPTGLPEPEPPAGFPWGPEAAVMFGGPGHPAWRHHAHMARRHRAHMARMARRRRRMARGPHGHGPFPMFPLMLVVFLVVTFTVGVGAGFLAVLQLALVAWLVRAAVLAFGARRSGGSA